MRRGFFARHAGPECLARESGFEVDLVFRENIADFVAVCLGRASRTVEKFLSTGAAA
jgi:hypothetical protein